MSCDNFRFDIYSEEDVALTAVLRIAFEETGKYPYKAVGYRIIKALQPYNYQGERDMPTLVLYKTIPSGKKDFIPFLVPLAATACSVIVSEWLKQQDYGEKPDHDGDNGKGWRVYNESWGHVDNDREAICGIQPSWAWYGK